MQRIFLPHSIFRSLLNEPINLLRPALIGFGRQSITSCHVTVASSSTLLSVAPSASRPWTPIRSVKIYTRTGDQGQSSLFTGERRSKTDQVFHALGTVDELSCVIGLALSHLETAKSPLDDASKINTVCSQLELIQSRLLAVGSAVATPLTMNSADPSSPTSRPNRFARVNFSNEFVENELEPWIDSMTSEIPPLRQFILPSGGVVGCTLHLARAVCRRAERHVIASSYDHPDSTKDTNGIEPGELVVVVEPSVIRYLNRLSDYLFTTARYVTWLCGLSEKPVRIK